MNRYFMKIMTAVFIIGAVMVQPNYIVKAETASTQYADIFTVNKEIYSDECLMLTCDEINKSGIVFTCENRTSKDLMIIMDISLDGILQSVWGDANECNIPSGSSKSFTYNGEIKHVQHKTMSIVATCFADGTGYLEFDVCDADLGGEANPDEIKSGNVVYESDSLCVEGLGTFSEGIQFKVCNKKEEKIELYIDTLTYNNGENGYGSAMSFPPHSEGVFRHYLTNYISDFKPGSIESYSAEIVCRYSDDNEYITINYPEEAENINMEKESTDEKNGNVSESTEVITEPSEEVIDTVVSEICEKYSTNPSEWEFYSDNPNVPIPESCLKNVTEYPYEGLKLYNIENTDLIACYAAELMACGMEIVTIEEGHMYQATMDGSPMCFFGGAQEGKDLLLVVSLEESEKIANKGTGNVCLECGKLASKSYTNPFSGKDEYYCTEHYNEIMDIIDMMEEDVGKGEYSKHICEVDDCNKEGTNSITGFSGLPEYYCTEHYNEMLDIVAHMLGE